MVYQNAFSTFEDFWDDDQGWSYGDWHDASWTNDEPGWSSDDWHESHWVEDSPAQEDLTAAPVTDDEYQKLEQEAADATARRGSQPHDGSGEEGSAERR